jgi:hypothetical protein
MTGRYVVRRECDGGTAGVIVLARVMKATIDGVRLCVNARVGGVTISG